MASRSPLSPQLLIYAYSNGYFPMPDPATGQVGWFRPDPRAILPLDQFQVSRSLRRQLNEAARTLRVTVDQAFKQVMEACADRDSTWISGEFIKSYTELHQRGYAHSIEVWDGNETLVGGVYGVAVSGAFFAESMFHRRTGASKVALHHLVEHMRSRGMELLEIQFMTPHLKSLGAVEISDDSYMQLLQKALDSKSRFTATP